MRPTNIVLADNAKKKLKIFLKDMFMTKEIWLGGVVDFSSSTSNVIKLTTQSIFSHVNFWDPKRKWGLGAEDLQKVSLVDYNKYDEQGHFYYVSKKLDIEYMANIFKFDYIQSVFCILGKTSQDDGSIDILKQRYSQYLTIRVGKSLEEVFEYFWKNGFSYDGIKSRYRNLNKLDRTYLDEFIILGVIKYIKNSYGKKYDLGGTLSICLTPWINAGVEDKEFFCSEFVSEGLLYAGIYPFDIKTKDPKSATPGDILDLSHIYCNSMTGLHKISHAGVFDLEIQKDTQLTNIKNFIFFLEDEHIVSQKNSALFFRSLIYRFSSYSKKLTAIKYGIFGYLAFLSSIAIYNSGVIGMSADASNPSGSMLLFPLYFMQYLMYSIMILLLVLIIGGYYLYLRFAHDDYPNFGK